MEISGIQFTLQQEPTFGIPSKRWVFIGQIFRKRLQIPGRIDQLDHPSCYPLLQSVLGIPWTGLNVPKRSMYWYLSNDVLTHVISRRIAPADKIGTDAVPV